MDDEYEDAVPVQATRPTTPSDEYEDAYEDAPASSGPLSWGDVAKGAVVNALPSAGQFAKDVVTPFIHPIETGKNLARVGMGALEKAGIGYGHGHEKYADAIGQFIADRYGGMENIKHTMATDPVGVLGDFAMALSGGEGLLTRAPAIMGRAGEAARAVGRGMGAVQPYVDPIGVAAKYVVNPALRGAGNMASIGIGELGTHTGKESVRTAARAGYEAPIWGSGEGAKAFQENLRDQAEMREPVDEARKAVGNLREIRGQQYRDELAATGADKTVHPQIWTNIADALKKASEINTFEGRDLSPSTKAFRQKIGQEIFDWYNLPPDTYHTLLGFDALKRTIGNIRQATEYGSPDRAVADMVYHSIRNGIAKESPTYAKAMEGYEKASGIIDELERTLSLNPNATVDTALRKLQSVLRDNVNTSFGRRAELAKYLVDAGAPHLMERLAGQSMKATTPRGLGKLMAGEIAALAAGHFTGLTGPGALAAIPATLALTSPRLMGEAAYYSGKLARFFPGQRSARIAQQMREGQTQQPAEQRQPLKIEVRPPLPQGVPPKDQRPVGFVYTDPQGKRHQWDGERWRG